MKDWLFLFSRKDGASSSGADLQSPDPVKLTCPVCLDDDKMVIAYIQIFCRNLECEIVNVFLSISLNICFGCSH